MFHVPLAFPVLRLEHLSGFQKYYQALKFAREAFDAISSRRLMPMRSFHLCDRVNCLMGISGQDTLYPVFQKDYKKLVHFLVAIEDKRFYAHSGIDFIAVLRAIRKNIQCLRIVQGGSTITQQLVRNTLLTPTRSLTRKLLEILLALEIEKHYSKEEILDLYCQSIYLGPGLRGFGTASKILFRKPLSRLNDYEICGLLGLLRSPSFFFPKKQKNAFYNRQKFIHNVLIKRNILERKPMVTPREDLNPIDVRTLQKPRFTAICEHVIQREYGNVRPLVWKVQMTINQLMQRVLDKTLREASREENISHAAAVLLLTPSCEIVGESSWQDGKETQFSPTFFGKIQPGSTFKTFALLAALEQGFTLDLKLISSPYKSEFIKDEHNLPWSVRNYNHIYRGTVSLWEAFKTSDNTAFARLIELLDLDKVIDVYRKFGLCPPGEGSHAIVLGASTGGVSLLDLASAYSTIAKNGVIRKPSFLKCVCLPNGKFIWSQAEPDRLVGVDYAVITEIKRALHYAGFRVGGFHFSGKTGTTKAGSLFAGYNDQISLAIWLGFKKTPREDVSKGPTVLKVLTKLVQGLLGHRQDLFAIT